MRPGTLPSVDSVATRWHCPAVAKKDVTVRMRAATSEVKRWKRAARRASRSLSDWMRLTLSNAASPPAKDSASPHADQQAERK